MSHFIYNDLFVGSLSYTLGLVHLYGVDMTPFGDVGYQLSGTPTVPRQLIDIEGTYNYKVSKTLGLRPKTWAKMVALYHQSMPTYEQCIAAYHGDFGTLDAWSVGVTAFRPQQIGSGRTSAALNIRNIESHWLVELVRGYGWMVYAHTAFCPNYPGSTVIIPRLAMQQAVVTTYPQHRLLTHNEAILTYGETPLHIVDYKKIGRASLPMNTKVGYTTLQKPAREALKIVNKNLTKLQSGDLSRAVELLNRIIINHDPLEAWVQFAPMYTRINNSYALSHDLLVQILQ